MHTGYEKVRASGRRVLEISNVSFVYRFVGRVSTTSCYNGFVSSFVV